MKAGRAAELLRRTALFGHADEAALDQLAERAIERTYKRGQLIFYQGDPAEALFVVIEGRIKVVVTSEGGDEMLLVTLGPGDVFGEIAVIDGGPRSASAETLEQTKVLMLTRATFLETIRTSAEMTDSLLRSLGSVLRRLTEQTADLVFLDLHGRVAKLLLALAEKQDPSAEGVELDVQLTQTDLASMVGGSRQSVNQILRAFERRGYVEMHGRRLVVKDTDALRRRAAR